MPRMRSLPELCRYLWTRLGSMSLAIVLLIVLSLASVIGTILLQNQEQADYLQQFGPLWYWVFRSLGLFDMYHTWWFLTLLGFLMLSLTACLWRHVPKMLVEMKHRKATLPLHALKHFRLKEQWRVPAGQQQQLIKRFGQLLPGWEVASAETPEALFVRADKGRWNKWGYILVHAAILIILTGGLISVQFGFRGNMAVPEGGVDDSIQFLQGTETKTLKMPFSIRCNRFHIEFFPTGAPKEFRSNLTIIDGGREVKTADIVVNEPLYYKGVRIYQSSFGDGGSEITLKLFRMDASQRVETIKTRVYQSYKDPESGVTLEITNFRAFNVENMAEPGKPRHFQDLGPAVEFILRGPGLKPVKIKNFMNPFIDANGNNQGSFMLISLTGNEQDYRPLSLGLDLTNPDEWRLFHAFMKRLAESGIKDQKRKSLEAFKLALKDVFGDKRPEKFQFMAMRVVQSVNILTQLPWPVIPLLTDFEQRYYTGLELARDPGMNVVWIGSALLVLGLCIMFYLPHRKLWLVLQPGKQQTTVTLAGQVTRNELAFRNTFHELFTQLFQDHPQQ